MTEQNTPPPGDGSVRRVGRSARRGKRRRVVPGHTVAKVITATLLTLALTTGVSVAVIYNHWNSNIEHKEIAGQLKNRPDKVEVEGPQEPLNILVMGSDTREGAGNKIDGESGGGLSDTTILVHLSADRSFAYGISIPRDTLVDRPECYREDGTSIPAATSVMWNEAYAVGGPACTVQQLEQVSGVRVDDYVVIDFGGFKDMVNALDGVEVCIPEDINDEEHGIVLKAGTREIKGDEALSYVRVRHIGSGTDPERIKRQQAFMAAMMNKVLSGGTLARPDRMVSFMNALTDSIQTDFDSLGELVDLAGSFAGIGPSNVKFVTTPWVYSTAQPGRVEWTPEVDKLWQLVINDKPLTREFVDQSISAADDPEGSSATASETAGPSADATPTDSGSPTASAGSSPSASGRPGGGTGNKAEGGLSDEARAAAGLCT
ncbi:LytR family transcriptional regulator [Nocardioides sp. GY 10113]|uniref:LCP family protein n=1 Tax=Nocardioides sp. GY 10113 TaxID=2569761 RepID=UPI0010A8B684|nr:LCP family protein [Nocardioides sp. GY 10113]TIC88233.1 LytR family transcriptional regulator [Nocardioides sp. GY 10113]